MSPRTFVSSYSSDTEYRISPSKDTGLYPSAGTLLWRATWPYLPAALLNLMKYTPTALYGRLRRLNALFEEVGRPLYKASAEDWDGSREEKRDVMSVLSKYS